MSNTSTFMTAGVDADDTQLLEIIRSALYARSEHERSDWLRQIELGLDGYGDRHRETAARIRGVLRSLALEIDGKSGSPRPRAAEGRPA